ncbi:MAG: peptide chain release factor N(5)-glutamine methyltransferase [Cyclobacteriaceae bacterium]
MTNSKELFNDLVRQVTLTEGKGEIQSIVYLILEKELGLTKINILAGENINLPDRSVFNQYLTRINNHEPIQYILGEEIFYGRKFKVNPSVLIPRPETELLVDKIKSFAHQSKNKTLRILDIGTGSGCIAISLALEIPGLVVTAVDVSEDALACAKQNATSLMAPVNFLRLDILNEEITSQFDLIVSNPPYISKEEISTIRRNVLDYEPHLALFAPGRDPLVFYKVIALKSRKALAGGGSLWFELNEHFGEDVKIILEDLDYKKVQIFKDLDNKDRIAMAHRVEDSVY